MLYNLCQMYIITNTVYVYSVQQQEVNFILIICYIRDLQQSSCFLTQRYRFACVITDFIPSRCDIFRETFNGHVHKTVHARDIMCSEVLVDNSEI
jgi:hypothetical protein